MARTARQLLALSWLRCGAGAICLTAALTRGWALGISEFLSAGFQYCNYSDHLAVRSSGCVLEVQLLEIVGLRWV